MANVKLTYLSADYLFISNNNTLCTYNTMFTYTFYTIYFFQHNISNINYANGVINMIKYHFK